MDVFGVVPCATMTEVTDDLVYSSAMIMFAALPMLSMRARLLQQTDSGHVELSRVIAVLAFVLLLWLQLSKQNLLGVAMVTINLL